MTVIQFILCLSVMVILGVTIGNILNELHSRYVRKENNKWRITLFTIPNPVPELDFESLKRSMTVNTNSVTYKVSCGAYSVTETKYYNSVKACLKDYQQFIKEVDNYFYSTYKSEVDYARNKENV